jgi:hypothetical protein
MDTEEDFAAVDVAVAGVVDAVSVASEVRAVG